MTVLKLDSAERGFLSNCDLANLPSTLETLWIPNGNRLSNRYMQYLAKLPLLSELSSRVHAFDRDEKCIPSLTSLIASGYLTFPSSFWDDYTLKSIKDVLPKNSLLRLPSSVEVIRATFTGELQTDSFDHLPHLKELSYTCFAEQAEMPRILASLVSLAVSAYKSFRRGFGADLRLPRSLTSLTIDLILKLLCCNIESLNSLTELDVSARFTLPQDVLMKLPAGLTSLRCAHLWRMTCRRPSRSSLEASRHFT